MLWRCLFRNCVLCQVLFCHAGLSLPLACKLLFWIIFQGIGGKSEKFFSGCFILILNQFLKRLLCVGKVEIIVHRQLDAYQVQLGFKS